MNKSNKLFAILGLMFGHVPMFSIDSRSPVSKKPSVPHEGLRQAQRAARQGLHMVNTRSGFQIMQRLAGCKQ